MPQMLLLADKLRRDLHSRKYVGGVIVAICGPDGSGKSELTARLAAVLSRHGPVVRIHQRPSVLPRRAPRGPVTRPHRHPPYMALLSNVKLVYLFVDTLLGWTLRLRPAVQHGSFVLIERPWVDIAVDPRRYRLGVGPHRVRTLGRLLPQPDLMIVLHAPAELLHLRKAELPVEELQRQLGAWRVIAPPNDRCVYLDVSFSLDWVTDRALDAISSRQDSCSAAAR